MTNKNAKKIWKQQRVGSQPQKKDNNPMAIQILENFFPELRESEGERIRKSLIRSFTNQHSSNFPTADGFTREQILAWLEKQGEKSWSEEDEKMLEDTISCLSAYQSPDISKGLCYQEQIDWLKSLKPRWKPSEEQMKELKKECLAHSNYQLCRLLEELEKL